MSELAEHSIVVLDPFVSQQPRWCADCGRMETFVEVYEFEGGRIGYCFGCGEERVRWAERTTNSEAA